MRQAPVPLLWPPMAIHATLEPAHVLVRHGSMHVNTCTYKVEIHVILVQIMAANDVRMLKQAEKKGLSGQGSPPRVLHPRVVGYFVLDDEFDRDLVSPEAMRGRHDEAIAACSEFIAKTVPPREFRVQDVIAREPGRQLVCKGRRRWARGHQWR